ncbi:MAG: hypothetical protein AAGH99_14620 [Planctomycetota bacterium]
MRTEALTWFMSWVLMLALGLAATLFLVGCETAGTAVDVPALATSSAASPAGSPQQAGENTLAQETRALAERLSASIDSTAGDDFDPGFDPFADVAPFPSERPAPSPAPGIDSGSDAGAKVAAVDPQTDTAVAVDVPGGALELRPDPIASVGGTVVPMPAGPRPLSRENLLAELSAQIRASDDPALSKAVTAAALSLAQPDHQLDPAVLEPLKPMQRDAVKRLHMLFLGIHKRAAEQGAESPTSRLRVGGPTTMGGGGFDRKTLDEALADAFGEMPITIVHADLCRSVSGYGVYEPLGTHNFLAGRANRAIVYVEVEDFAAAKLDDDRREVRLTQELILYEEENGLAVWRHEPAQIEDISRNRRRDFYVVQMITLPARLSVGKYRLKVRITDQHGDSVDETTLKIHVVADARLLDDDVLQ